MTTLPAVVRIVDLPTGTTVTGGELVEAIQTVGGVQISVQLAIGSAIASIGALPTGGGTSQILAKASGTNFSSAWYDVTSFVSINTTSLATTGSGTALVIGVKTAGIGSGQLGALAVQSSNVTTNAIGNTQFRQGTGLSVVGVAANATANVADIVGSAPLQVLQVNAGATGIAFTALVQGSAFVGITNTGLFSQSGTVLATGTFGVVGTSQFTGVFNIAGTTLVTGNLGVVGTTLVTGTFGQVGTANFTSNAFNVVGTATFTSGAFNIIGTTNVTGVFNQVGTSLMTGRFGVSGTANFTGAFNVVGTALFTSGTFGVVGTTQFTGTFGIAGTTIVTGTLGLSSLTAGVLVASSTGVVSNQGGMVLLNTLSPNGVASTNDTTSFTSAYRTYMFSIEDVVPVTNTTVFQMTVATSGSNFISGGYFSYVQNTIIGGQTSTSVFLISGTGATVSVSSSTLYGVNGVMYLHNPASSVTRKSVEGFVTYATASAAIGTASVAGSQIGGFFDGNSNPITGVNFVFSSGNIATGTIRVYGIT